MDIPCKVYRAKVNLAKEGDIIETTTATKNHNTQTGLTNGGFGATMSQTETRVPLPRTQTAKISYKSAALKNQHIETESKTTTTTRTNAYTTTTVQNLTKMKSEEDVELVQNNDAIKSQIYEFNRQKIERTQEMQEINEMLEDLSKSPVKLSVRTNENEGSCSTSTYYSHKQQEQPVSAAAAAAVNPEIATFNIESNIAPEGIPLTKKPSTDRPSYNYNRSKSDMHYVTPRTAVTYRECARANAVSTTMHSRSQSSYALHSANEAKQKFYDRNDTRRFMEEQRKKRRFNAGFNSEAQKTAREKEEIKKRLEELRKNTRKILNKNMQKRQKQSTATLVHKEPTQHGNLTGRLTFKQPTPRVCNISETTEKSANVQENIEKCDQIVQTINNETNAKAPLVKNKKRIGLLRKPETNDHSYSAINDTGFNKENVAVDILTPKFAAALETHLASRTCFAKEEEKPTTNIVQRKHEEVVNLRVPPESLGSRVHLESEATSARLFEEADVADVPFDKSHRLHQLKSEMPYWLKPSAVQVYPYNFICAVRRKLECITNPVTCVPVKVHTATSTAAMPVEPKTLNQTTSTGDLLENMPFNNESAKKKTQNYRDVKNLSSSWSSATINQDAAIAVDVDAEASQSEEMTNYSSISIQLPDSNTASEVTSLTSEYHMSSKSRALKVEIEEKKLQKLATSARNMHSVNNISEKGKPVDMVNDDDTTVSSAIFNSVEITSTHFKSKDNSVLENDFQFIVPQRVSSPLNLEKVKKLQILPKNERKTQDEGTPAIDFDKFLVDFNRSLSQVIEVNEKLKNTIEKSPSSYRNDCQTIDARTHSTKISLKEEYATDDFEESTHAHESPSVPISEASQINTAESHTINTLNDQRSQKIMALKKKLAQAMVERSRKSSKSNSSQSSIRSLHVSETSFINPSQNKCTKTEGQNNSQDATSSNISTEPASNVTRTISTHFHEGSATLATAESIKEEMRKEHELSVCENDNAIKLRAKHRQSHIQTHVNDRRGDFLSPTNHNNKNEILNEEEELKLLPSSSASSLGKEIATAFKHNDLEVCVSLSESSFNYSSVGQYEKLIQKETTKSEQLTLLLKMREKALLDRTKGQIAWLELQKERYKSKGLLVQIAAIKKKQRAILLKMEKEREEIKRLLQAKTSSSNLSTHSSSHKERRDSDNEAVAAATPLTAPAELLLSHKTSIKPLTSHSSRKVSTTRKLCHEKGFQEQNSNNRNNQGIVRANYELETSRSLEELLHRREADLRRRREHVERLMEWHRRLDEEEADVKQLEHMLLKYNNEHLQYQNHEEKNNLETTATTPTPTTKTNQGLVVENINNNINNNNNTQSDYSNNSSTNRKEKIYSKQQQQQQSDRCLNNRAIKMERRLNKIDHSLRELGSISSGAHTSTHSHSHNHNHSHSGAEQQHSGSGSATESVGNLMNVDFVRTNGNKLNKLWRRLTSQQVERFEPLRSYKLCKADLERLYEDAKLAVLNDFSKNEECLAGELLATSTVSSASSTEKTDEIVPALNLSFCQSTDRSAGDQTERDTTANDGQDEVEESARGTYHAIVRGEELNFTNHSNCSTISDLNNLPYTSTERQRIIEENVEKFVNLTSQLLVKHADLQRSASDTEISSVSVKSSSRSSSVTSGSIETAAPTLNSVHNVLVEIIEESENAELIQVDSKTSYEEQTSSASVKSDEALIIEEKQGEEEQQQQQQQQFSDSNATIETSEHASEEINNSNITNSNELVEHLSQSSESTNNNNNNNNNNCKNNSNSKTSTEIAEEVSNLNSNGSSYSMQFEEEEKVVEEEIENAENTLIADSSSLGEEDVEMKLSENLTKTYHFIQEEEDELEEETDPYSADFELSLDETQIADISTPHFESTFDTTRDESDNDMSKSIDVNTVFNAVSTLSQLTPPPAPPPPPTLTTTVLNVSSSSATAAGQLMPDIINELEIRRCQQIFIENEHLKQYEHVTAVPYVYVREIPNKPPPPYVPPDHGSPMTTIFPSEERIKDITYRNTHELYCKLLKTDYIDERGEKLPSVHDEKITNIYERIILDICREYLEEHHEVLKQGDPENFHSQLAFFNPPDRLRCLQESIYREVRRCLAMNKTSPKRSQVYSVYGQRAKRDHIGKIITQELYDEDDKWCNFRHEEQEVLELIVEEMVAKYLHQIATEVLLEEGGQVENVSEHTQTIMDETLPSTSNIAIAKATANTDATT